MANLLVVDGNSVLNRAFYATTNLTNGATYGFLNMLFREIIESNATHLAVAFDVRAKTFRHQIFADYKAGRRPMPDDLAAQLADTRNLLGIMGIKIFEMAGFEADDLLGTMASKASAAGHDVIVMTGDRDMLQLVGERVVVHLCTTNDTQVYNTGRIRMEYGVTPRQLIDVKALMGDKSDNIPGAKNVGEKTAVALIKDYESVEKLLATIDRSPFALRASVREKVEACRDIVITSRALAEIKCDVDLDFHIDKLEFALPLSKEVYEAFKIRNFHSLCRRENLWADGVVQKKPTQQSFF